MAKTSFSPSWRIVVDASVTSSASDREDVPDPILRRCRELLEAILRICHRIVRLSGMQKPDSEASVLAKDRFLVEAALATDAIVVSRDDIARECFRRAATAIGTLRAIVWGNPVTDDLILWLEGKTKPTPAMTLGVARPEDSL